MVDWKKRYHTNLCCAWPHSLRWYLVVLYGVSNVSQREACIGKEIFARRQWEALSPSISIHHRISSTPFPATQHICEFHVEIIYGEYVLWNTTLPVSIPHNWLIRDICINMRAIDCTSAIFEVWEKAIVLFNVWQCTVWGFLHVICVEWYQDEHIKDVFNGAGCVIRSHNW